MQDRIRLRSYNKINNIEKMIYAFQNFKLPIPISLYDLIYFCVCLLIMFLINKILPFLGVIPPMLKYIIIPFFTARYMRKKTFDGKKPWKYAIDYTIYMFNRNTMYERFKPVKLPKEIRFANPNFRES